MNAPSRQFGQQRKLELKHPQSLVRQFRDQHWKFSKLPSKYFNQNGLSPLGHAVCGTQWFSELGTFVLRKHGLNPPRETEDSFVHELRRAHKHRATRGLHWPRKQLSSAAKHARKLLEYSMRSNLRPRSISTRSERLRKNLNIDVIHISYAVARKESLQELLNHLHGEPTSRQRLQRLLDFIESSLARSSAAKKSGRPVEQSGILIRSCVRCWYKAGKGDARGLTAFARDAFSAAERHAPEDHAMRFARKAAMRFWKEHDETAKERGHLSTTC